MKACPFCAEDIQDAAVLCKHCHRSVIGPAAVLTASPVEDARLSASRVFAKTLHCLAIGWSAYMFLATLSGMINSAKAGSASIAQAVGFTFGIGVLSLAWLIPVIGLEAIAVSATVLAGRLTTATVSRREWWRALWIAAGPNLAVVAIGGWSVFYALL